MIRRLIKLILFLVVVAILTFGGYLIYASITTLHTKDVEKMDITGKKSLDLNINNEISILSWNIGYAALGDNEDFFMDGGKHVISKDVNRVIENLDKIITNINSNNPDILFLQEVDIKSRRSNNINQKKKIEEDISKDKYMSSFAQNYKAGYVPYPFPTMIGNVDSGIMTLSKFELSSSDRIQLPIPFSWPMSMVNLKRCLLINRIKLSNNKELVLINLHLEAYDDGEGKIQQTEMLKKYMDEENKKGNYIIVGGDFNQTFSNIDSKKYPYYEGNWKQGAIDSTLFNDYQLLMDNTYPTCRLLNKPYKDSDKSTFQYYMIDGFMVSKNIQINSINTLNYDFVNSDHNPVLLKIKLV